MKLKNITIKEGKPANLKLKKEDKTYLPEQEFEVSNERGKELLKMEIDGKPIVEKVKESKESTEQKEEKASQNENIQENLQ